MDTNKPWFNMFALIFELVSAFAGIGLSLGFPGVASTFIYLIKSKSFSWSGCGQDNFSLSGTMKPLSKLVIIVIMYVKSSALLSFRINQIGRCRIRGRHRGLPVAIDRAVLLPTELVVNPSTGPDKRTADLTGTNVRSPTSPAPQEYHVNGQEV